MRIRLHILVPGPEAPGGGPCPASDHKHPQNTCLARAAHGPHPLIFLTGSPSQPQTSQAPEEPLLSHL